MTDRDKREPYSKDNLSSSIRITFGRSDSIKQVGKREVKDRNIKEFFPLVNQVFYSSSYYKKHGKGDENLIAVKNVLPLMSKMNSLGRIRNKKKPILEEKLKEKLKDYLIRIGYNIEEVSKFIDENFIGTMKDKLNLCGTVSCTVAAIAEMERAEEEKLLN